MLRVFIRLFNKPAKKVLNKKVNPKNVDKFIQMCSFWVDNSVFLTLGTSKNLIFKRCDSYCCRAVHANRCMIKFHLYTDLYAES